MYRMFKKTWKTLKQNLEAKDNRVLRQRQFIREHLWITDSIAYRLAKRANTEIKEIEVARSKKKDCVKSIEIIVYFLAA